MINADPNMSRKQIFKELPLPSDLKEVSNELLYKALFISIKLQLDARLNMVKLSEGKKISTRHTDDGKRSGKKFEKKKEETGNTVIKDSDQIKIPVQVEVIDDKKDAVVSENPVDDIDKK